MLPVVKGDRETARSIVRYSVVMVAITLLPVLRADGRALLPGLGARARRDVPLARGRARARDHAVRAKRLFSYSLLYLALLFVALALDPMVL